TSVLRSVVVERSRPPKHSRPRRSSGVKSARHSSQRSTGSQRLRDEHQTLRRLVLKLFWLEGTSLALRAASRSSSSLTELPRLGLLLTQVLSSSQSSLSSSV